MPEVIPFWFGSLYGLGWLVVARLAVEVRRSNQRARTSRQMLMRLSRWRHC